MLLGNKIRSLRDEQGILQRQVAVYLEIDTPSSVVFCCGMTPQLLLSPRRE